MSVTWLTKKRPNETGSGWNCPNSSTRTRSKQDWKTHLKKLRKNWARRLMKSLPCRINLARKIHLPLDK